MARVLGFVAVFLLVFSLGIILTGRPDDQHTADAPQTPQATNARPAVDMMRPGLWSFEIRNSIIDMPQATPNQLSEARQANDEVREVRKCLVDGGKNNVFEDALSPFDDCRVKGRPRADGRIEGRVVCRPGLTSEPEQFGTVSGQQEGLRVDANIDMRVNVGNAGPADVRISINARHLSDDCGEYRPAPESGNGPLVMP